MKNGIRTYTFILLLLLIFLLGIGSYVKLFYLNKKPSSVVENIQKQVPSSSPNIKSDLYTQSPKMMALLFLDFIVFILGAGIVIKGLVFDYKFSKRRIKLRNLGIGSGIRAPALNNKSFAQIICLILFFYFSLKFIQLSVYEIYSGDLFLLTVFFAMALNTFGSIVIIHYRHLYKSLLLRKKKLISKFIQSCKIYVSILPLFIGAIFITLFLFKYLNVSAEPQAAILALLKEHHPLVLMGLFLMIAVFAPIFEELLFRGVIYAYLRKSCRFWLAGLLSGSLFAVAHSNAYSFFPILVLGFSFAYIYERSNKIIIPIFVHAIHNLVTFLLVFLTKMHYTI